jgi:hypothetical protein
MSVKLTKCRKMRLARVQNVEPGILNFNVYFTLRIRSI